jgi:GTP diphosphokinase / guanosine-3',5'-bis(diphosphate) 3'-diphosphatase
MPTGTQAISETELQKINDSFDSLLASLKPKLKGNDAEEIRKAFNLSLDAHKYQRRKSGEAYIFHPLEVARICHEEIGLGPTAIICAILHDVVEDTPINLEEIFALFGPKVTHIVDGLTKLDGLYNGENLNAENLKKVLSTLVDDVRVVLIKMADRLHNLRTIGAMPEHKKLKIAAETMYIYAPLAHRLGLYSIKTEFEDICMRITDPDRYKEISKKILATEEQRTRYIQKFIAPLKQKITELNVPFHILGRPKAISSIWNKIKNKNIEFEEIFDIFAVRIIVDVPRALEKSFCWQVYSIITDYYKPIPERLKDWVTTPKGNGYESLHTTVIGPSGRFVEVQIRSERMDDIAERGFAAHWKYKGIKSDDNVYEKWLDNIRNLLDNQNDDAVDFLNDFKTNLFKEEVYVFTPNGDMRILPKGATALDFAFDIHSDVGAQATSFKVNNKLVPMGYVLQNGDQITVNTTKGQSPKEDWLKLVITGKARAKIRASLNEKIKQAANFGKEQVIRKLKNHKLEIDSNIEFMVNHYGYKTRQDFYLAIYNEHLKLSELGKTFDTVNGHLKEKISEIPQQVEDKQPQEKKIIPTQVGSRKSKSPIIINNQPDESFDYSLSSCCNPVPGDEIFAFLTSNAGMKIHRFNCSNATNLFTNYGYRILKADWARELTTEFVVALKITGIDTGPGVIQQITNEISNHLGINIKSFSITGDEGVFEGDIKITVRDKKQLDQLINRIKKMDHVSTIERTIM